jgi:outer membrane receptor protein involved in Fe transport
MKQTFLLIIILLISTLTYSQVEIKGKIQDNITQLPLAGVNIKLKHKLVGTVSNPDGEFTFNTRENPPFQLEISMVGYQMQTIDIASDIDNLKVNMVEEVYFGEEIIVSASRVPENILQSSVSVEKLDIREINATGAPNFYDALANIKGIDMNTHSLLFKLPNSRGFNGETNFRFNQLIDGIDNAPPGLSFAAGNINGLPQLDVESVELIMGASSALYGPGGMNGTMLITSKNPFEYPGLSASIQTAAMNIGSEASDVTPMLDANIRYAKVFNNKFAVKVVASYLKAQDWAATDNRNRLDLDDTDLNHYTNPGYDGVNVYGDDVIVPVNLEDFGPQIADGVAQTQGYLPGSPEYDAEVARVLSLVPNQLVTRTGFKEADLHDYDTYNFRGRLSLNYRIKPDLELELQGGYTIGTSIYTAQTRYALNNFEAYNSKLELKNPDFFIRAWAVKENAGNTYDVGGSAMQFNEAWKSSEDWYTDFIASWTSAFIYPGGSPLDNSYQIARTAADNRSPNGNIQNPSEVARPIPGTTEFEQLWQPIIDRPVSEGGGLVIDHSSMYHIEGMYDFSKFFNKTSLQVGASNRIYKLDSDGSIFFDTPGNPITQNQFGAYGQLIQPFYRDRLKVTVSGRFDKNSSFNGQFTPRMSLVYALDKEKSHNIRASTQTAFRFPATADQWLNLSLGQMDINGKQFNFRVIGGNEEVHEAYNITSENVYALSGNNPFIGVPENEPFQVPVFRPETVTALEIGYKGLYFDKVLFLDTYFFHNTYNSFHAKQALAQNPGTANENRYITTISAENPVVTYGWAVGADMMIPGGYLLKGNLMNNSIDLGENETSGFQSRFNTPAYKINISLVNYHVLQNIGFSVSWRWQTSFNWESDFGKTTIPSYNTIDAQVSVKLPQWSSVVKLGGSNLLNQYYASGFGNSAIGGLYYVSVTFDEFLN